MTPTLLLFDIDGTLVFTGRAGMRAMVRTFEAEFGVADAFRTSRWAGAPIVAAVGGAGEWGIEDTPEHHSRFGPRMCHAWPRRSCIPAPDEGRDAGVRELLDALGDHSHLHLALLTGNYRDAAEIKLRHFGLWDYFPFGVFSDDSADRNALVPMAGDRAREQGVPMVPARAWW